MSDLAKIEQSIKDFTAEWEKYKIANDERLAGIEKKGFETAEQKEKFEKMDAAVDEFHDSHGKLVKEFEESKELKGRIDLLETALRRPRSSGIVGVEVDPRFSLPEYVEHKELLDKYFRYGSDPALHNKAVQPNQLAKLAELETKVLRTSSDPDGGYSLTPEREAGILERVTETSPMRQVADVTSIAGDTWEQLREVGALSGGGWVSEQGSRTAGTSPTFGLVSIPVHEQYEMPTATQKMLDDAGFQVEVYVGGKVETVMVARENTSFITGTGVGQPRGIMTYTDGTDDTVFEVEQVPSLSASTVTADGFIDTQEALLEAYQANARWLMRRATRGVTRKLKDGQGNYILNVDFSAGGAATILGKPVVPCSDIAAIAGAALVAAYGDFRQAYKIVDRIGIRVLRDPYSSKPNVLFYTTKRTGGGVVQPQAYKIMDVAAS